MAISYWLHFRTPATWSYSSLLLSFLLANAVAPAQAQNSVTLKRDQLETVRPFQARRQIQIIDESPEVKDLRRPKDSGPNYVINVGPGPGSAPSGGTVVLTPERSSLTPAGFQTQIPAGGFSKPGLTPATLGGHAPTGDAARGGKPGGGARPLMSASGKLTTQSPPTASAPLVYHKTDGSGPSTLDTRFNTQTKADLHGKLLTRD